MHFCWPEQFRSHDLDTGGGSAFLETAVDATKHFVESTARERERMALKVRQSALRLLKEEFEQGAKNSGEETQPDTQKQKQLLAKLEYMSEELIGRDTKLLALLSPHREKAPTDCDKANTAFKKWLEKGVRGWETAKYENIIIGLTEGVNEHKKAACSPNYHILLAWIEELQQEPNHSQTHQDNHSQENERMVALFYNALSKSDPSLNTIRLHGALGSLLIILHQDFFQGLRHIEHAIKLTKHYQTQLMSRQSLRKLASDKTNHKKNPCSDKQYDEQLCSDQLYELMVNSQIYHELLYAQFVPLSPIPIPGHIHEVSDLDVLTWERRSLNFSEGKSLLEGIASREFTNTVPYRLKEIIKSEELKIEGNQYKDEIHKELSHLYDAMKQNEHKPNESPCSDMAEGPSHEHKRQKKEVCESIAKIRGHIRAHLAEAVGIEEAEERVKELYARYISDPEKTGNLGPDILSTYGMLLAIKNMGKPCPARGVILDRADALIREAIELISLQRRQEGGTKKTEEKIEQDLNRLRVERYTKYHNFTTTLGCT
jgi:hypothetical protein